MLLPYSSSQLRLAEELSNQVRVYAHEQEGITRGIVSVVDRVSLVPIALQSLANFGWGEAELNLQQKMLKVAEQSATLARNGRKSATDLSKYMLEKNRNAASYDDILPWYTQPGSEIVNENLIATAVTPVNTPRISPNTVTELANGLQSLVEGIPFLQRLTFLLDEAVHDEGRSGGMVMAAILGLYKDEQVVPTYIQAVGEFNPGICGIAKAKAKAAIITGEPSGEKSHFKNPKISHLKGAVPVSLLSGKPMVITVAGLAKDIDDRQLIEDTVFRIGAPLGISLLGLQR